MKKPLLLFSLLLFSSFLYAQNLSVSQLLERSKSFYETSLNYEATAAFKVYRGYEKEELLATDEMLTIRHENFLLTRRSGMDLIYDNGKMLTVDHRNKHIQLQVAQSVDQQLAFMDVEVYLKQFERQEIDDMGSFYRLHLSTPILTQLPYTEVIMDFSKSDFAMIRQEFVMAGGVNYTNANGQQTVDYKRVEIRITSFKTSNFDYDRSNFQIDNYIKQSNSALVTTGEYKQYSITDRTLK